MPTRNNKNRLKNSIKTYLNSEEGKILDSDLVKAAIALGIIGAVTPDLTPQAVFHTNAMSSSAHLNHVSHGSHSSHGSHGSHSAHGSHGSHSAHGSHGAHGSHSRGGWC